MIEEEIRQLVVDRYLMKRVLINLIANATQAMPDGGTLTVKVTQEDGTAPVV